MLTFSIITCTYNAEGVLQRTLDSIAQQDYPGIQHIIVDGLSKDNTMDMVERYRKAQYESAHDIVVVSEKDNGLYDAMNKAIALATGDYLVFINAGDTLHSNDTLTQIAQQEIGNAGVIYGNTDIVDDNGNSLHPRRLSPPDRLTWRSFRNGMLVCHQAFYARTEIAKGVAYDLQYRLSADVDWCIRIMKETEKRGMSLHNTNMTLCNYLDGGMSVQNHRASLIERFRIMSHHYGLLTTLFMHFKFIFR